MPGVDAVPERVDVGLFTERRIADVFRAVRFLKTLRGQI
jgi:hypothetical protein